MKKVIVFLVLFLTIQLSVVECFADNGEINYDREKTKTSISGGLSATIDKESGVLKVNLRIEQSVLVEIKDKEGVVYSAVIEERHVTIDIAFLSEDEVYVLNVYSEDYSYQEIFEL